MDCAMRKCQKCNETKPLEEFHKNKSRPLGRNYVCIPCTSAYSREYVRRSDAKIKAAARSKKYHATDHARERTRRYDKSEQRMAYKKTYNKSKSHVESRAKIAKRLRVEGKTKAHKLVFHRLTKQPCERCGSTIRVHGHHEDYSKPLEVMWLCPIHHAERHREIKIEKMAAAESGVG
jgi:hypothetical protein